MSAGGQEEGREEGRREGGGRVGERTLTSGKLVRAMRLPACSIRLSASRLRSRRFRRVAWPISSWWRQAVRWRATKRGRRGARD